MKKFSAGLALAAAVLLAGCANTGSHYRSDTYYAGQVNQAQEVRTVEIVAVMPAKIVVDNTENVRTARTIGALVGAVGGALIGQNSGSDWHRGSNRAVGAVVGGVAGGVAGQAIGGGGNTREVDGVQITFRDGSRMFNSAQVGRPCEYRPGTAVIVSPRPNETRIQPNNPYGCGES